MAITLPLAAQPTFTSDDFLQAFLKLNASGTTDYTSTGSVGLQTFITTTGADQTWDLSSISFSSGTVSSSGKTVVAYPGGAANASDFTGATHVLIGTSGNATTYEFIKIDQTGLYIMGATEDSAGVISTKLKYSPPLQNLKFPMTYLTQWSSTSSVQVAGVPLAVTQSIDGLADAWGTAKVPNLTESQCVRVRTKLSSSIPGLYSYSQYSFNWYNSTGFNLSIFADSNQKATGADYSVPHSSSVASPTAAGSDVRILGNPAISGSSVQFALPEDANVKIELLDVLGNQAELVMNGPAHSGINHIPIPTSALINGSYMIRVQSPNFTATQKLIIAH